jgi:protein-disulfide isomerase
MKRFLPIIVSASALALAACVDTTGLSESLSRNAHPNTDPNAVVQVAEFADFQCPACRAAHEQIVKPIIAKYGKKIRYDFMHFPLRSIHPYALSAAEASECAADQGKFWEFVDINYANQDKLNKDVFADWGKQLGLDVDTFDRCIRSGIKRDAILAEYEQGKEVGVAGTPTFYVNGKRVESGVEELSAAIDAALASPTQKL